MTAIHLTTAGTDTGVLLREDAGGVATLTLNRPDQYNALSAALLATLQSALHDLADDTSVRVVVIAGAGKAFCAGHDLKEINEHADPAVARDLEAAMERIVGDDWGWQHIEDGEENAPSHVRASLAGPQVLVPLQDGRLALGTWQGIFFCEFDGPRERTVYVSVLA